ncbi:sigma-70 family RNA polymerase sigma factor [Ruminococcus sp. YE282]|uniref:sigma-70 family RNA polymerase sigma factor n=1 Tax=Ruminococcus sp. YE282 TaxID=3158780 RepID=UPI00115F81BF
MDDYEDILSEQEEEQFAEALADEHQAELEVQLERDEEPPQINEPPETRKLKRELEREALLRIENAARTTDDFKKVIAWWNRLDSNRERKERYHEISRSGLDIPLDYGAKLDGEIIPYDVNDVLIKQIRKGDYIDAIFHCPFELNELVTDGDLSKILDKLSDDHREIIFNTIVRNMSTKALGDVRGQTDRNIRKVRATAIKKIHKSLLRVLQSRKENGIPLTLNEKLLIKKALDDNKGS